MIIRSRIVAPMVGEPIENAAVAINGNQIAGVGRWTEIKASHGGEIIDLGEMILMPGLINAHCHLDYTALRDQIPPERCFTDWVRAINSHKAKLSDEDYIASIHTGLIEVQKFGTTSLLNLEAFPQLLPRLRHPFPRVWWCAEMIDVRNEVPVEDIAKSLHDWFESHPEWLGGFGMAPHALFTASRQLFSTSSELARKYDVPMTTHLAESREEMQMFRQANGTLFDFLKSIGRQMDDCGSKTPLSSLLMNQAVGQRWIIAHVNDLAEEDFDLLSRTEKFHVVHCPCSHAFFGHPPFALQRLQKLGFNICLGTDSLASNSSLSLFSEMRELLRKEPWLSPREVLEMVTVDAARAIGQAHSLGRISPGFHADMIAIPSSNTGDRVFDTISAFEGPVPWMMVNGRELGIG